MSRTQPQILGDMKKALERAEERGREHGRKDHAESLEEGAKHLPLDPDVIAEEILKNHYEEGGMLQKAIAHGIRSVMRPFAVTVGDHLRALEATKKDLGEEKRKTLRTLQGIHNMQESMADALRDMGPLQDTIERDTGRRLETVGFPISVLKGWSEELEGLTAPRAEERKS